MKSSKTVAFVRFSSTEAAPLELDAISFKEFNAVSLSVRTGRPCYRLDGFDDFLQEDLIKLEADLEAYAVKWIFLLFEEEALTTLHSDCLERFLSEGRIITIEVLLRDDRSDGSQFAYQERIFRRSYFSVESLLRFNRTGRDPESVISLYGVRSCYEIEVRDLSRYAYHMVKDGGLHLSGEKLNAFAPISAMAAHEALESLSDPETDISNKMKAWWLEQSQDAPTLTWHMAQLAMKACSWDRALFYLTHQTVDYGKSRFVYPFAPEVFYSGLLNPLAEIPNPALQAYEYSRIHVPHIQLRPHCNAYAAGEFLAIYSGFFSSIAQYLQRSGIFKPLENYESLYNEWDSIPEPPQWWGPREPIEFSVKETAAFRKELINNFEDLIVGKHSSDLSAHPLLPVRLGRCLLQSRNALHALIEYLSQNETFCFVNPLGTTLTLCSGSLKALL